MNRYYKFNSKPSKLPKYANAGEILKSPEMGTMYSQTGNIVGNAIEGTIDTNYTLDKNPYANNKMVYSNAARFAGQGASIGTMIAPGIGTAIGAGVGLVGGAVYGAVQQDKMNKEYKEWKDTTIKNNTNQGLSNYQTDLIMGFNPKGNRYATYPKGGQLPPIIVTDPNDSRLKDYNDSLAAFKAGQENLRRLLNVGFRQDGRTLNYNQYDREFNKPYNPSTFRRPILYSNDGYDAHSPFQYKHRSNNNIGYDISQIQLKAAPEEVILRKGRNYVNFPNTYIPLTSDAAYNYTTGEYIRSRNTRSLNGVVVDDSGWRVERDTRQRHTQDESTRVYLPMHKKPVQPVVYQKPKPVVKKENIIIGNQKTFNKLNSKSPLVLEKDGYYRNDAGDVFKFESKPVVKTDIADAPVLPNNKPTPVKKNTTTSTTSTTPIKKEPITPTPTTPVNNSPKFRIQGNGSDYIKLGLDAQKNYTQQEIIDAAKKKGLDKALKFNSNIAYLVFAKGGIIQRYAQGGEIKSMSDLNKNTEREIAFTSSKTNSQFDKLADKYTPINNIPSKANTATYSPLIEPPKTKEVVKPKVLTKPVSTNITTSKNININNPFINSSDSSEVMTRQVNDFKKYGKFVLQGKDVLNRTDYNRNNDSKKYISDNIQQGDVIIDIGSGLGNRDAKLAGVSVKELYDNSNIKSKAAAIIATDIPSEIKSFEANKNRYNIDYATVSDKNFNTDIAGILKNKNLQNSKNIILRSANSLDLIMNKENTLSHFNHLATTLKDKKVTYIFNNKVLTKNAGSDKWQITGDINNRAFDHRQSSWKVDNKKPSYTNRNNYMVKFASGGKIHIKPENKGKFTAWAKSHGMGVQEAASHVMANKEKYSSTIVKRANFAKNAKKFKHDMGGVLVRYAKGGKIHNYEVGGNFQPEYEVEKNEVIQGNDVKLTNGKQISNDMHLATGYTHEQNNPKTGGTGVYGVGGQRVFSNRSMPSEFLLDSLKALKIPVSKKDTHANIVLSIAKKQNKFEKGIDAVNHRERKTSEIMMERLNNAKELVFLDQELQKAPTENPNDQYMQGQDMQEPAYQQEQQVQAKGGMIKRKDGSYSKRGLWDNIRANKGSGKKPTKEMLEQEAKIKNSYAKGGYIVKRSSARKGKTHVVIGPDGTKKYFGDSKLGQHPSDPKRKKSFYARHKHNLAKNPYFRAFARATWADGGELPMNTSSRYINPIYSNKNLIKFAKGGKVKKYYEGGNPTIKIAPYATNDPMANAYNWEERNKQFRTMEQMGTPSPKLGVTGNRYSNIDYLTNPNYKIADNNKVIIPSPMLGRNNNNNQVIDYTTGNVVPSPTYNSSIINPNEEDKGSMELATLAEQERKSLPMNPASVEPSKLNTPFSNSSTNINLNTNNKLNLNKTNPNLKDNWGTITNTLNLVSNLQAVNNLKSFNNPQYPVAPRLQYNSNLPYNIYENAKAGKTALANLNRYNPSASNRYAVNANVIEANNRAFMEDNIRRGEFNNQVALSRNAVENQRIAIDNQIAENKINLANEKVAQRNNAINTWATGEMQNKLYRDQVGLSRERMNLEFMDRYGNVGDRFFKGKTKSQIAKMMEGVTDPVLLAKGQEAILTAPE